MAIAVLSADEIRRIDKQSIEEIGIPGCVLMEVAGRAVAETAEALIGDAGRVLVVCGKGNNGGDGFVAARHLLTHGHEVRCALLGKTDALQGDAAQNAQIFARLGGVITACLGEDAVDSLDFENSDLVVDALFGNGLSKDVTGLYAQVIDRMNASTAPLIAVDMPSGVSADTGQILGRGLRADVTVTFGAPKRGQLLFPGADLCGDLHVVDIGLPPQAFEDKGLSLWLLAEDDIAEYLNLRASDAHKGNFGHLLVLAGSQNKPGAAGLCVEAGLRGGAGLVTLAAPLTVLQQVIAGPCEAMGEAVETYEALAAVSSRKTAIALGPGLGQEPEVARMVLRAVEEIGVPMIIDADGLNLLVGHLDLLAQAKAPRVLTPHPGEMARLLGQDTKTVQADRIGAAERLAKDSGAVVVLKGAHSVVADPEGQTFIVPTGNPGMATGGSGDVLTGLIGSMLAEGMESLEAACVATYVHGLAGDLASLAGSQRAMKAGDILKRLPEVFSRFEADSDGEEVDAASD